MMDSDVERTGRAISSRLITLEMDLSGIYKNQETDIKNILIFQRRTARFYFYFGFEKS